MGILRPHTIAVCLTIVMMAIGWQQCVEARHRRCGKDVYVYFLVDTSSYVKQGEFNAFKNHMKSVARKITLARYFGVGFGKPRSVFLGGHFSRVVARRIDKYLKSSQTTVRVFIKSLRYGLNFLRRVRTQSKGRKKIFVIIYSKIGKPPPRAQRLLRRFTHYAVVYYILTGKGKASAFLKSMRNFQRAGSPQSWTAVDRVIHRGICPKVKRQVKRKVQRKVKQKVQRKRCPKSRTIRGQCVNGRMYVRHIYFVRTRRGSCKKKTFRKRVPCGPTKPCTCSVLGDPHYQTYDGQPLHFYGICKYTLTKLLKSMKRNRCYFNIEHKTEHRGLNHRVSYLRLLDIKMFGHTFRIHQRRRLYVDGKFKAVPYKFGKDVKIFRSGAYLQFDAVRCGVRVAFDGRSNAFITVSGRYRNKMTGMCGNCNGVRMDDLRTKTGIDVRSMPANVKFNMIGDSFGVRDDSDRPVRRCKTPPAPKRFCRTKRDRRRAQALCGNIRSRSGPFRKCIQSRKVANGVMYRDCIIDACVTSRNQRRQMSAVCEAYRGAAEACAEAGIPNISWRRKRFCPIHCGRNAVYSTNLNPCPKTCENHFFGTRTLCFKLPKREGCQCRPGFLRDGALCVKAKDCKCLELCIDREKPAKCRQWKRRGRCKKFPNAMRNICPLTCGMCKKKAARCVDHISTRRCEKFKRKGLCTRSFYREVCHLTCNPKSCPCPKPFTKTSKCHRVFKYRTVRRHTFKRNSSGHCLKVIKISYKPCGKCVRFKRVKVGRCNYCKRRRIVSIVSRFRRGHRCILRKRKRSRRCGCPSRGRPAVSYVTRCVGNRTRLRTEIRYKIKGCFRCFRVTKRRRYRMRCRKPWKKAGKCGKNNHQLVKNFKEVPKKCMCVRRVRLTSVRCRCPKERTKVFCRNRCWYRVTTSYKLTKRGCVKKRKTKRFCKKCKGTIYKRRRCNRKVCLQRVDKIFYVKMGNCKCKKIINSDAKVCCCPKARTRIGCDKVRGLLIKTTKSYRLRRGKCYSTRLIRKTVVRCRRRPRRIRGRCNRRTCRQQLRVSYFRRRGCHCVGNTIRYRVACCCRPARKIVKLCLRHRYLATVVKRYVLRRGRCVTVKKTIMRRRVSCKRPITRRGRCNLRTRRRVDKIIRFRLKNCKCRQRRPRKVVRPCGCRRQRTRRHGCNRRSCKRKIVITRFVPKRRGGCKAVKIVKKQLCCCAKKPRATKKCIKATGNTLYRTVRYVFDRKTRSCSKKVTKRYRFLKCRRKPKVVKTIGMCNIITPFVHDVVLYVRKHRSKCRCRTIKRKRRRRCACPKCRNSKKRCYGNKIRWKKICFRLVGNKCRRIILKRYRRVYCKYSRKKIVGKCNPKTCKKYTTYFIVKRRGCVCAKRKIVKTRVCCCPFVKTKKKCLGSHYVKLFTYFRVNRRKTACIRRIKSKTIRIRCVGKRTFVKKCNRKSCFAAKVRVIYRVRKCKCKAVNRRTTKRRCCCPRRKYRVTCNARIGRRTRSLKYYKLRRGVCQPRYKHTHTRIKCPKDRISVGRCGKGARTRRVVITSYKRRGCRCVKSTVVQRRTCRCPGNRIVRERCRRGSMTRRIRHIEFQLDRKKRRCVKKIVRTFREACRCPKGKRRVYCRRGLRVTKTIVYNMRRRGGIRTCIKSIKKKHRRTICRNGKKYWTACRYHRKYKRQYIYRTVNCKCVFSRVRTIKVRGCNCRKRNSKSRVCYGRYGVIIYKRFYRKGALCARVIKRKKFAPVCSKKIKVKRIRPCTVKIRRLRGIFRLIRVTKFVVRRCRCVRKTKIVRKLCRCLPSKSRSRCHPARGVTVTTVIRYYPKRNRCYYKLTRTRRKTRCSRAVHKETGRCNRSTCRVGIKVHFFVRSACRCERSHFKLYVRCCCKNARREVRRCARRSGLLVRRTVRKRLVAAGIAFKRGRLVVQNYRCKTSTKTTKRRITCARGKTVKKYCNEKTGVYTKYREYYVRRGCRCQKKTEKVRGRCRCRKTRKLVGKCVGNFRRNTLIRYVQVRSNCERRVRRMRERCRCYHPAKNRQCDGRGNMVTTITKYRLTPDKRCERITKRKKKPVVCRQPKERLIKKGPCDYRKTHKRKLTFARIVVNRSRCRCQLKSRVKFVDCYCNQKKVIHSKPKCRNGRIVIKIRFQRLVRNRCITIRRRLIKRVSCPVTRRLLGPCLFKGKNKGWRKKVVILHRRFRCKCYKKILRYRIPCMCSKINRYRTRKRKLCLGNNKKITIWLYYVAKGGYCQPRRRKITRTVVCKGPRWSRRNGRCNRKTCVYVRTLYRRVVRKCKCVKVVKKKYRRRCCCPKTRVVARKCKRHRNLSIKKRKFRLRRGICIASYVEKRIKIPKCRGRRRKRGPCNRKTCDQTVIFLKRMNRNCRCPMVKVAQRVRKCCCPKARIVQRCHRSTGRFVYKDYRYRHSGGKCLSLFKSEERRVRCSGKKWTRSGRCQNGMRRMRLYSTVRRGCKCVKKLIRMYSLSCKCRKYTWRRKYPCPPKGKGNSRKIVLYGQVYSRQDRKCKTRILKEIRIPCRCRHRRRVTSRCIRDTILRRTYYSWRLRRRTGECTRVKRVRDQRLSCSRTPRFIRKRRGRCDSKGYQVDTYYYNYARNCVCRTKIRRSRWPCRCSSMYKPRIVKLCKGTYYFKRVLRWRNAGKTCTIIIKTYRRPIYCRRRKSVKRGKCLKVKKGKKVIRRRKIKIFRHIVRNCKCIKKLRKVVFVTCGCPKALRTRKCFPKKKLLVFYRRYYRIARNRCLLFSVKKTIKVRCAAGVKTYRSKCRKGQRYFSIKRVKTRFNSRNCGCRITISRRRCNCFCPKPRDYIGCSRRKGILRVKYTHYFKKKCGCLKRSITEHRKITCTPRKPKIGRCIRSSGYRQVILYKRVRKGCKCRTKMKLWRRVCYCRRERRSQRICRKNKYHIRVTRQRVMSVKRNKCIWMVVAYKKQRVTCGRTRVISRCNRKTRKEHVTILRPVVKNCRCRRTRQTRVRKCKCRSGLRFYRDGRCNRRTCTKYSRYVYEKLVKKKCVRRYLNKRRTCCCPKSIKRRFCMKRKGIRRQIRVTFRFRRGSCIRRVVRRDHKISCPISRKIRKTCNKKTGVGFVIVFANRRIGCKCRSKRIGVIKIRCGCSKRKGSSKRCLRNRRLFIVKSWAYKLKNNACTKIVKTVIRRLSCPAPYISTGPCGRKTGVRLLHKVRFRLNSRCKCVRRRITIRKRCRCKPKISYKRCLKSKGVLISVKVKERLRGGICRRRTIIRKTHVSCFGVPRLVKMGVCRGGRRILYYARRKRVGCRCKLIYIRRRCSCVCPRRRVSKRCVGRFLVRTSISYRFKGCSCQAIRSKTKKFVSCPKRKVIKRACGAAGRCIQEKVLVYYRRKRCRCHKRRRIFKKKCCCPPSKVKKRCLKRTGVRLKVRVTYRLRYGFCQRRTIKTRTKIRCRRRPHFQRKSACRNGRITLLMRYFVRRFCKCVRVKRLIRRRCGCKRPVKIKGHCNNRTCRRRIKKIIYIRRGRRCVRRHRYRKEICCCRRRTRRRKVCIKGRLVHISSYWQYRSATKSCLYKSRTRDITPRCKPARVIKSRRCNRRSGVLRITVIKRRLVRCKCRKTIKTYKLRCRCPKTTFKRKCVGKGVRRETQVVYKLKNNRCAVRIISRSVTIKCPKRKVIIAKACNRITARQRIIIIKYKLKGCMCKKTTKRRQRVCGCRLNTTIKYKYCDAKRGIRYLKARKQIYDKRRHRCISKIFIISRPVVCNKRVIRHRGPCNVLRGRRRYRSSTRFFSQRFACRCIRRRQTRLRLCACGRPRFRKVCRRGVIITYRDVFYLKRYRTRRGRRVRCVRRSKPFTQRLVRCRLRAWKERGRCNRKTGLRFVYTKKQVKRGCRCLTEKRREKTICRCLKKPTKSRQRCVRGRKLTIRFSYQKVCKNFRCRCVLKRTFIKKFIRCRAPRIRKRKCRHGRRRVTVTAYLNRRCRCKRRIRSKNIRCRRACRNLLPDADCREYERGGYCENDVRVRNKICRKTCGVCFKCRKGKVAFRVMFRKGLLTDKLYNQQFFIRRLRNKKFISCRTVCARDPRCNSFEVVPRRKKKARYDCILNTVTPKSLARRVLKVKFTKTKRFLYVKYCVKRCPSKKLVTLVQRCKCKGKGMTRVCTQKFRVVSYRNDRRGRCKSFKRIIRTPCGMPCLDLAKRSLCLLMRRGGRCRRAEVRVLCNKTCNACRCPSSKVRRGRCKRTKKGKWFRQYVIIKYKRFVGMCKVKIIKLKRRCRPPKRCRINFYRVIRRCKGGVRVILTITNYQTRDFQCKRSVKVIKKSCAGCCEDVRVRVGKCKPALTLRYKSKRQRKTRALRYYSRRVSYSYYVKERGCCRLKIYRRHMSCHRFACPKRRTIVGPCVLKRRLRYVIFYEYDRSNKRCQRHSHSRKEACYHPSPIGRACRDRMPHRTCQRLKKKKNICLLAAGPVLCAKTCGHCEKVAKILKKRKRKPYKKQTKKQRDRILKNVKSWNEARAFQKSVDLKRQLRKRYRAVLKALAKAQRKKYDALKKKLAAKKKKETVLLAKKPNKAKKVENTLKKLAEKISSKSKGGVKSKSKVKSGKKGGKKTTKKSSLKKTKKTTKTKTTKTKTTKTKTTKTTKTKTTKTKGTKTSAKKAKKTSEKGTKKTTTKKSTTKKGKKTEGKSGGGEKSTKKKEASEK